MRLGGDGFFPHLRVLLSDEEGTQPSPGCQNISLQNRKQSYFSSLPSPAGCTDHQPLVSLSDSNAVVQLHNHHRSHTIIIVLNCLQLQSQQFYAWLLDLFHLILMQLTTSYHENGVGMCWGEGVMVRNLNLCPILSGLVNTS